MRTSVGIALPPVPGRWVRYNRPVPADPPRAEPAAPDVQVHALAAGAGSRLRALRLRSLAGGQQALSGDLDEESTAAPQHWEDLVARPGRATLVATLDGTDVGLLHCGPPTWNADADPSEFDLGGAWVDPAARGRGVIDALVRAALGHALTRGARAVTLWVHQDNHPAARVFARHGFGPTGRELHSDLGVRYLEQRHDLPVP